MFVSKKLLSVVFLEFFEILFFLIACVLIFSIFSCLDVFHVFVFSLLMFSCFSCLDFFHFLFVCVNIFSFLSFFHVLIFSFFIFSFRYFSHIFSLCVDFFLFPFFHVSDFFQKGSREAKATLKSFKTVVFFCHFLIFSFVTSVMESFQPRQMLDQLIFSDGWIARTCLNKTAWLTVRAVVLTKQASCPCLSFCEKRVATGTSHFSSRICCRN